MSNNQYYYLLRDSQNNLRELIELQRYNLEIIDRFTNNRRLNNRSPRRLNSSFSPFYYSWFNTNDMRQNNNTQMNGLTQEQINNLTTSDSFENISNPLEITECPITQTEFTNNMTVTRINCCNHIFSRDSLLTWLANHNTCPVCRTNITNNNQQNDDENNVQENNNTNDNTTDNTTDNTNNIQDNNFSFYTSTIYDNNIYNNGRRFPLNNTTFSDNLLNSFTQHFNRLYPPITRDQNNNTNQLNTNEENNNTNQ